MSDFVGRIAIVTGAAAGIGQAVCQHLLELGAIVGGIDRQSEGIPAGVTPLIADVTDQDSLNQAVAEFAKLHGRLDVLINNAGVSFVGTIEDGSDEDWLRIFNINVLGYMRSTRACLPYLRQSPNAVIVNMSSCTAINGLPERALYSASKGAIQSMTLAMSADLIAEHIRVVGIAPATVDTPFMTELANRTSDPAAKRNEFHRRQPTGQMVQPEEVARLVAHVAHPGALSYTGTIINIDGGMATLRMPHSTH